MPIPHDKCLLSVAKIAFPLVLMQYRFFWNPNAASQVAFFQTQTFLHLIGERDGRLGSVPQRPGGPCEYIKRKNPPSPYQNEVSDAGFGYTNQLCIAERHCGQISRLDRGGRV